MWVLRLKTWTYTKAHHELLHIFLAIFLLDGINIIMLEKSIYNLMGKMKLPQVTTMCNF